MSIFRRKWLWIAVAGLLLVGLGWWFGFDVRNPRGMWETLGLRSAGDTATATVAGAGDHEHDHEHDEHVDISTAAAENLGMRLEILQRAAYTKQLHIPAAIVEKPGQSGLAVTSPIQGIVTRIHCFPGQALNQGDLLFTMRVTDEALEAAQLSLLDILTRVTVTQREIDRLDPLAESGAVVGRRKLEMEYQLKTLLSEQAARLQELRLRGLSPGQVEAITKRRELIREIEIRLEDVDADPQSSLGRPQEDLSHTVEQLNVYPGKSVRKGDELCHVANHFELYVRGEAFESDVPAIHQAMQDALGIALEVREGAGVHRVEGLSVTYMDNHVDTRTQTYPFYLPIPNRVVSQQQDAAGRTFRSWQFKPGQRAHLFVPAETWPDQLVVPREAVVRGGIESYVFRLEPSLEDIAFSRTAEERFQRLDKLTTWTLHPVPVRVLQQDREYAVLQTGGTLVEHDIVLVSGGYQAYLAWRLQMSGGGGHGHEH